MWNKHSATLRYTAFGVMFGLLFPLVATLGDVLIQGLPLALESLGQVQMNNPLHWMIDTAPLFLGLFAILAGRRQDQLTRLNRELAQEAQDHKQVLRQLQIARADMSQQMVEQRADLTTAIEVGRVAVSILELETLAREVVDLVRERFDLYYTGLFLLDDPGEYAVLEAGTGESGRTMKEQGHKLEVGGQSIVGAACAQRQARMAVGVGEEPVRFDNPLLPDTRSELALPLVVGDRVLGALNVQSTQPTAFSEKEIAVLQLVANQVAVAVDNARKFSDEAALLEATSPLFRVSRRLVTAATTDEIVQTILDSIAGTEADGCAVATFDLSPEGETETITFLGAWNRWGVSRFPTGVPLPPSTIFPIEMARDFLIVEDAAQDTRLPEPTQQFLSRAGLSALVNIPLRAGDQGIGFIIIDRVKTGSFSKVALQLYEALTDQASVALERARLLEAAQRRAAREQAIRQVTERMRRSVDVESILQNTVAELARALGAPRAYVRLGIEAELQPTAGMHLEPSGEMVPTCTPRDE
jgi:GAF domain-containing protein